MKMDQIKIGRIVNAHGIKGEVRVQARKVDPEFLTHFKTFYIDGQPVKPTSKHLHKNLVLMKFPGVDDMNTALTYKEKDLYIRRDDAHLPDGECFDDELIGMEVYNEETGELLGKITLVEEYPASKVYTVKGSREYLIPAIKDVFIRSVNLEENRMEVHVLEGLATDEH